MPTIKYYLHKISKYLNITYITMCVCICNIIYNNIHNGYIVYY